MIPFTRLLQGMVILAILLAIPVASIRSHGDKHDDNEKEEGEKVVLTDSVQTIQDSVYSIINENYQTVKHFFEYSCFDCHSTSTDYPWYYKLPLIKGMIDSDIKEAKEHIDMSDDFPFGGHATQFEQLKEIREEIAEKEMPLMSYRIMHWGKLIEGTRQDSVFTWIDSSIKLLQQNGLATEDDDEEEDDD